MHSYRDHKLTETLKRARDQFQFYGDYHMSKPVPQVEKANVNYGYVAEINEALLTAYPTPVSDAPKVVPATEPPRDAFGEFIAAQPLDLGEPVRDPDTFVMAPEAPVDEG
jgi:hypothetical protein